MLLQASVTNPRFLQCFLMFPNCFSSSPLATLLWLDMLLLLMWPAQLFTVAPTMYIAFKNSFHTREFLLISNPSSSNRIPGLTHSLLISKKKQYVRILPSSFACLFCIIYPMFKLCDSRFMVSNVRERPPQNNLEGIFGTHTTA